MARTFFEQALRPERLLQIGQFVSRPPASSSWHHIAASDGPRSSLRARIAFFFFRDLSEYPIKILAHSQRSNTPRNELASSRSHIRSDCV